MALKSTEWFIDTFPSIVGLSSGDHPFSDIPSDTESAPSEVHPTTPSRLLLQECEGDEHLRVICEKFCHINRCKYTRGLAAVVSPIAGIMTFESPRLIAHLVALGAFRDRFCIVPPAPLASRSYSSLIKSAFAPSKSAPRTESWDLFTTNVVVSLIRFHRPNIMAIMEAMFGLNQLAPTLHTWLSTSMLSICDGATTARELMASIAATGECASGACLLVAALDEIFSNSSFLINSPEALLQALDSFTVSPDKLVSLWGTASGIAACTPAQLGKDLFAFGTFTGRRTLEQNESHGIPEIFQTIDGLTLASLNGKDVVASESGNHSEKPVNEHVNKSLSFSIGEDTSSSRCWLSMECIAGASIESSLRPFVDNKKNNSDSFIQSLETVIVDARTKEERRIDNACIIFPVAGENQREESKDWFNSSDDGDVDHGGGEESSHSTDEPTVTPIHILRLKNSVWVDEDLDFQSIQAPSEIESLFLKKLEFFRGHLVCVIGLHATAKRLTEILLEREFPYVACVRGGFKSIIDALAEDSSSISLRAITEPVPVMEQKGEDQGIVGGRISFTAQAKDLTNQAKKRIAGFFKPTHTSPPAVPGIIVAPSPTLSVVVGKAMAPPTSLFEIGGEEVEEDEFGQRIGTRRDEDDFSSVDLSPN
jgi:hypothetical protein